MSNFGHNVLSLLVQQLLALLGPGGECLGARDRLNEVRSLTGSFFCGFFRSVCSEQLGFMVVVWLHLSEAKLGPLDLIGRFYPCFGGVTFNNRGQLGSG